jgi:hypothetical protein
MVRAEGGTFDLVVSAHLYLVTRLKRIARRSLPSLDVAEKLLKAPAAPKNTSQ